MKRAAQNSLYLAWVLSLAGALMSLVAGELLQIEPCHLCWYQRIALFPICLFLGMALYKNETKITHYVLPLAAAGALVALYQAIGQKYPALLSSATCGSSDECENPVFTLFGFLTFPLLSFFGFALISALLYFAQKGVLSPPSCRDSGGSKNP